MTTLPGVKRIIPLEEVAQREYYEDMAQLAVIFNHEVVEMNDGTWRWKPNRLVCHLMDNAPLADSLHRDIRGKLSLNQLVCDLRGDHKFTIEEWMKWYMQMGYSLGGYSECFGQEEASDLNLPDAKPIPEGHYDSDEAEYVETPIDYMLRIHAGKVLAL